jgi:DHA1 family bicyclomycin/chloramphenicol resistance-like MFS transporter
VLGAAVLAYADWRATFWILASATLAAAPFAIRAAPRQLPGLDRTIPSSYWSVLKNRKFTRLAFSHALGMGALLTFIASSPQLMSRSAFAALQIIGVAAFMIFASQAASFFGVRSFVAYALFWFMFCGALAVRGPAAFSDALELPASQLGRGSALMVLAILGAGAIGTQIVAPLLRDGSPSGMFVALLFACVGSVALVTPYPRTKA